MSNLTQYDFVTKDQLILNGQVQSSQQVAFYDELRTGTSSIILKAVAGSGKTTTIVNAARHVIPKHALTTFLAFNKKIAEELESRLPHNVTSSTFHSLCLSALSRALPKRPRIDAKKTFDLLKANLKWKDQEMYSSFANRLVSYAKSAGVGIPSLLPDEESSWDKLVAHFSLSLENRNADPQRGIEIARQAFNDSVSDTSVIDFDDMLYLALARRVKFDVSNFIFIDEAQDTNGVQRELLKLMGRFEIRNEMIDDGKGSIIERQVSTSRLIAVGDPMQAIYGFRGADSNALTLLREDFNAKTLPLSVCYRCSQSVIAEVWKNFPKLKP